jgi:hypothetical protein
LLSAASAWTQVLNLPTTPVTYYADGGDHITGFFDVKLSNVPPGFSVSNGEYVGFCTSIFATSPTGLFHTALLFDSTSPTLPPVVPPAQWDLINYILNHPLGTADEVQAAIWIVDDGISILPVTPNVLQMVADAQANGQGFVPSNGQLDAVIVRAIDDTNVQNVIIPIPSPTGCPPVETCIQSDFNGTSISSNNFIWFNANFSAKGIPKTGATVVVGCGTITAISPKGTFTFNVPPAIIVFSPAATCATTTFDGTQWVTIVPVKGSDEILLSALGVKVPADLKQSKVTWCACVSADNPNIDIQWKWGAAVYTTDITAAHYNNLDVKPVHSGACFANNGEHAGTPHSVEKFVIGGARGGGGANFTGSFSGTTAVSLCP